MIKMSLENIKDLASIERLITKVDWCLHVYLSYRDAPLDSRKACCASPGNQHRWKVLNSKNEETLCLTKEVVSVETNSIFKEKSRRERKMFYLDGCTAAD